MPGDEDLSARLAGVVGPAHVIADPDVLTGRCVDYTGRYRGDGALLVRPGSPAEVAAVLVACRDAGRCVTVQGGRTSLVAGTVPEYRDVLLSTERVTAVGGMASTNAGGLRTVRYGNMGEQVLGLQARLPGDVTHRRRHRGHARDQGRPRSDGYLNPAVLFGGRVRG